MLIADTRSFIASTVIDKYEFLPEVSVFDYTNFRLYLRDSYQASKKSRYGYSFQLFAKKSGFASRSFLKMVIDGQRDLSLAAIEKINKAFAHSREQSAYFRALVGYNQSDSADEKQIFLDKMSKVKPPPSLTPLDKAKYKVLTDILYLVLREAVALPGFKEDAGAIRKALCFETTTEKIKEALKILLTLGLIKRDSKGKLAQVDTMVTTPPKVEALDAFNYHNQILDLAKKMLAEDPASFCDLTSMTIPVPEELIPEIQRLANDFRMQVAELVNAAGNVYKNVYLINVQAFPVTRFEGEDGELFAD